MSLVLRSLLVATLVVSGLTLAGAPAAACGPETGLDCTDVVIGQVEIGTGAGAGDTAHAMTEVLDAIMSGANAVWQAYEAVIAWVSQPQPPAGVFGPGFGDCYSCWDRD